MSSLEARIEAVEAELAIRNIIARYGLAADCGDVDTALSCHTADAVYIVSNPNAGRDRSEEADLELYGHRAIADMLNSERHQSLIPNCAHTVGPLVIVVNSEAAKVIGYSRVYNMVKAKPHLMRLAFNRWDMRRENGKWKIARRESRVMGEEAARDLLLMELSPHEDSI